MDDIKARARFPMKRFWWSMFWPAFTIGFFGSLCLAVVGLFYQFAFFEPHAADLSVLNVLAAFVLLTVGGIWPALTLIKARSTRKSWRATEHHRALIQQQRLQELAALEQDLDSLDAILHAKMPWVELRPAMLEKVQGMIAQYEHTSLMALVLMQEALLQPTTLATDLSAYLQAQRLRLRYERSPFPQDHVALSYAESALIHRA